jgi:hypothetical protein
VKKFLSSKGSNDACAWRNLFLMGFLDLVKKVREAGSGFSKHRADGLPTER